MDIKGKIGSFLESSKRILIVSKKPSSEEFWQISKITGIGIILIAVIGFVVYFLFALFLLGK
jgi:protein transport protein SEC61 subunit gamma-like protein